MGNRLTREFWGVTGSTVVSDFKRQSTSFDLVLIELCIETARGNPARGIMANTTKIEDKAERKALKRAARKKAAPKGPRTGPRGENKQKLKKASKGASKR
jgi:hypothetical protein